jgi:VIT1/CCC1 family predicted Fe2+/Mn2+ transporter
MAAGEYVSVHSQADTERADLDRERVELEQSPEAEHRELAAIYVARGIEPGLAAQVATQLMKHDALDAHARDELGISSTMSARPLQAAWASAASFAVGAGLPLAVAALAPTSAMAWWVSGTSVLFLGGLGAMAARIGGASGWVSAARVTFWGVVAMAITAAVGRWFGAVI